MYTANQLQTLREEATCSICLEYFNNPVSVACGHIFCLNCITKCWEELKLNFPCPQCREPSQTKVLRPIKQLANMVEIAKHLHVGSLAPQEDLCGQHGEKLKLFCEDDQKLICVICRESKDHRFHVVLPTAEAAQDYKDKFQMCLNTIKVKLESVSQFQCLQEMRMAVLKEQFKSQQKKMASEFESVEQFVQKLKCRRRNSLEEEEQKILQDFTKEVAVLERRKSSLKSLIREIEGTCQQQDLQLLKGVKTTLIRYNQIGKEKEKEEKELEEKLEDKEEDSEQKEEECEQKEEWEEKEEKWEQKEQKWEQKEEECEQKEEWEENEKWEEEEEVREKGNSPSKSDEELEDQSEEDKKIEDKFLPRFCQFPVDLQMDVVEALEWRWARGFAADITLDPDTAHPELLVSEDRKSVRQVEKAQDLPYILERFTSELIVLGRKKLNFGRHYWEVDVGNVAKWALGVCNESVSRTGEIILSPDDGYWTVCLLSGEYSALTDPPTPLSLRVAPKVVGLFLSFEDRMLSVYDVQDMALLFTFFQASFPLTLLPFFSFEIENGKIIEEELQILPVADLE